MNIWIITTGSSDVQLKTNNNWNALRSKVRNKLETQKQFGESKSKDGKRFLYPARAMGVVYGSAIENDPKHYEDLDFPLLNNFFCLLDRQEGRTEKIIIDRIIVIVTDQSESFKRAKRNDPSSPYWQDTCTLQPILEKYLKEKSSRKPEFLVLDPDPKKSSGLDNWNDVLERVQEKFKEKFSDPKDILEDTTIYVSHQAGTPAISSAVQFASLARFGDRVQFLVSNEQDETLTDIVESSTYLRGIKQEQARKLLDRRDYAGVMVLLKPYLNPKRSEEKRIRSLLKAAIQWNLAKFRTFKRLLIPLGIAQESDFLWYWIGYESGYLATVRLEQKDVVEALFHSFRASEGLICNWAECKYSRHIEYNSKNAPQLKETISQESEKLEAYWKETAKSNERWLKNPKNKHKSVGLFSSNLYKLFQCIYPESNKAPCMAIVWGSAKDERNQQFHRLLGLTEKDLYQAWGTKDKSSWKNMVLSCLNFIAKEDLPNEFKSLEDASLMVKVHQELEKALSQL